MEFWGILVWIQVDSLPLSTPSWFAWPCSIGWRPTAPTKRNCESAAWSWAYRWPHDPRFAVVGANLFSAGIYLYHKLFVWIRFKWKSSKAHPMRMQSNAVHDKWRLKFKILKPWSLWSSWCLLTGILGGGTYSLNQSFQGLWWEATSANLATIMESVVQFHAILTVQSSKSMWNQIQNHPWSMLNQLPTAPSTNGWPPLNPRSMSVNPSKPNTAFQSTFMDKISVCVSK